MMTRRGGGPYLRAGTPQCGRPLLAVGVRLDPGGRIRLISRRRP